MRAGGVRGAICRHLHRVARAAGARSLPRPTACSKLRRSRWPFDHARAAATAAVGIGRLARARARAACVRIARTSPTSTPPATDDGPPAAVLHLEGARGDRPGARGARAPGTRPGCARSGRSGAGRTRSPTASRSVPVLARHGPGLTRRRRALVRALRRARRSLVDLSHLNERGFWDVAALDAGPLVASHSGAHALCPASRNLTDAPARRDRRERRPRRDRVRDARSCARTSPTTPTRRSS